MAWKASMMLHHTPYMDVINDFRVKTLGLATRVRFASDLVKFIG